MKSEVALQLIIDSQVGRRLCCCTQSWASLVLSAVSTVDKNLVGLHQSSEKCLDRIFLFAKGGDVGGDSPTSYLVTQHCIKAKFYRSNMCSQFPLIKNCARPRVLSGDCQWSQQVFIRFLTERAEPQVRNKTVLATGRVRAETPLLSLLSLGLMVRWSDGLPSTSLSLVLVG